MNPKQFIKVTPKGSKESYVLPMQNKAFYISQGAEVTEPTEEEVAKAFPELAGKGEKKQNDAARVAELEKEIAEKDAIIAQLQSEIERLSLPAEANEVDDAEAVGEVPAEAEKPKRNKK